MTDLGVLADERAVIGMVIDYADALDSRDWEAFRALFADQVMMSSDLRPGNPVTLSADAMVTRVRSQVTQFNVTLHYVSNFAVTLDDDGATCRSYLYAQHVNTQENGGGRFVAHGTYIHTLQRGPAGWLISGLTVNLRIRDGEPPAPKS